MLEMCVLNKATRRQCAAVVRCLLLLPSSECFAFVVGVGHKLVHEMHSVTRPQYARMAAENQADRLAQNCSSVEENGSGGRLSDEQVEETQHKQNRETRDERTAASLLRLDSAAPFASQRLLCERVRHAHTRGSDLRHDSNSFAGLAHALFVEIRRVGDDGVKVLAQRAAHLRIGEVTRQR